MIEYAGMYVMRGYEKVAPKHYFEAGKRMSIVKKETEKKIVKYLS